MLINVCVQYPNDRMRTVDDALRLVVTCRVTEIPTMCFLLRFAGIEMKGTIGGMTGGMIGMATVGTAGGTPDVAGRAAIGPAAMTGAGAEIAAAAGSQTGGAGSRQRRAAGAQRCMLTKQSTLHLLQ